MKSINGFLCESYWTLTDPVVLSASAGLRMTKYSLCCLLSSHKVFVNPHLDLGVQGTVLNTAGGPCPAAVESAERKSLCALHHYLIPHNSQVASELVGSHAVPQDQPDKGKLDG